LILARGPGLAGGREAQGQRQQQADPDVPTERIERPGSALGHFGGDEGLLDHFTERIRDDGWSEARTSGRIALESHLLGFAAERARERGEVLDFAAWRSAWG